MKDYNTNLEDFTLKQLFCLTKEYKLKAIEMLIDSITEDKLYDERTEKETKIESEDYIHNKEIPQWVNDLTTGNVPEMRNISNNPKKEKPQAPKNQITDTSLHDYINTKVTIEKLLRNMDI